MIIELSSPPLNPSSTHYCGQEGKKRLIKSREAIGLYLNVHPNEIVFTSGGTESMNLLIQGILKSTPQAHIITSNAEHSCVYFTLKDYALKGCDITFLKPGLWGAIQLDEIQKALRPQTKAIVLSAVNSETGVKHDLKAIADLAERLGILFIVDGVALLGKEPMTIHKGISAIGFSGHKLHAPKGVGFVFIRNSLSLAPLFFGGDQECGRRAGTENLPGIVGLSTAITLLQTELPSATAQMATLRNQLEEGICSQLKNVVINGQGPRVVNTSNLSFPGVHGEDLLILLDRAKIAVSHGSACSSGALEPSRILTNMGLSTSMARSAIRFSLSRYTTEEEILTCIETLVRCVHQLTFSS